MRTCKERAAPKGRQWRRQQVVQKSCGIGSKLLKLVKKVAKAPITQKIGKMALNELLNLYEKGRSKIKNKKIKKLFQSDLANSLVDMGAKYGQKKLGWIFLMVEKQTSIKKEFIATKTKKILTVKK